MKSINKKCIVLILVASILCMFFAGCGSNIDLKYPYSNFTFLPDNNENLNYVDSESTVDFMAGNLCVTAENDINVDKITNNYVGAGGIFDVTNKEVLYGYHLFERRYPASMTKVLTAYLTIKYCDLSDMVTVSENAVNMPSGAVTCGINVGDSISVQDLLYALLLLSANDAAVALAEHISGSVEEFSKLMNEEAKLMGATHTNFVNPHGLHDDDHYTTVYDMYLMFNQAIQLDLFCEIINTMTYTATYQSVRGSQVQKTYSNTNKFLTGEKEYPDNFTVIGGKTGTTYNAGKCLVLYTIDEAGNKYILVAFGCDTRDILYDYMSRQMEYINDIK